MHMASVPSACVCLAVCCLFFSTYLYIGFLACLFAACVCFCLLKQRSYVYAFPTNSQFDFYI